MPANEKQKPGLFAAPRKKTVTRRNMPVKRSVNLAQGGEKSVKLQVAVPAIVLILIAAVLISKFAVVDRLNKVTRAENEVAKLQDQITQGYSKIESFGELTDLYAHYTYSGMTGDEIRRADRVEITNMIQRVVLPQVDLESWSLKGNKLVISVKGSSLQKMNMIAQKLEKEDIVDLCTVTTAATEENTKTSNSPVMAATVNNAIRIVSRNAVKAQFTVLLKSDGEVPVK